MLVTALTASAQLGGTERVLLDFASHAFEHDIALRVLTPKDGPLINILEQLGVPAEVVPASTTMLRGSQQPGRLLSLFPFLVSLPRWAAALARHRFWQDADVIYSVGFKAHTATMLHHDRKVVWHLHEFPPATTGTVWKGLARWVPDAVIANSAAVAEAWGRGKREEGRVTVVRNGVNLDRFKPRARTFWIHDQLGLPHDRRLIGMPAVFARWKGQLEVIEAFRDVHLAHPDTNLVLVGGSIYDTVGERELGALIERAVAQVDGAYRLPFQAKVEEVYPEFDLAVHYSLRPEAFGRVILEAMACGTPVIAAAEGGPLEILGEEGRGKREESVETSCGWLVPPRRPDLLAATLRDVLALPPQGLAGKGLAGRRRAEVEFSARGFARRVAIVLRRVAP